MGYDECMANSFDLSGKTALVTGASGGLGARFARVLADNGATVVLASRGLERLKELRAEIVASGGSAHVVELDITDLDSIEPAVERAEREAGPIDILVNNSGVSVTGRLADVTPEDFEYVFDTNVRGAFFVAQAVARRMIERAGQPNVDHPARGRIINIASMAAMRPLSKIGIYSMSKSAMVMMTRSMALEWGRFNINVSAICPGYIRTGINDSHWETEAGQKLIAMLPRKRLGQPEDLDGVLLLLASDQSDFINGAVISADDGFGA